MVRRVKRLVSRMTLGSQSAEEAREWLERSVEARVAAVEALREAWWKLNGIPTPRLERVVEVVRRAPRTVPGGGGARTRGSR
jgi:hypothetical protein